MGSVAGVTLGGEGEVELVGQGEPGHGESHAFRFGQGDAHVFDEVFDEEAGIEVNMRILGHASVQDVKHHSPRSDSCGGWHTENLATLAQLVSNWTCPFNCPASSVNEK